MKKNIFIIIIIIIIFLVIFVIYRLDDMEIKAAEIKEIEFGSGLSGSLYLPDKKGPYKVIVFIHGDGPTNRTLDGGYNFIINRFLKSGYACFSYDKAGISKSSGNWLSQTMRDRAKEVENAIPEIKEKVQVDSIGTLAFSQGGWVTSELAIMNTPLDFNIVVGGAIDWMEQHIYYETEYAKSLGYTEEKTQIYLDYVRKADSFIVSNDYEGYVNYVKSHDYEAPMTKERFHFVYLNFGSNAKKGIKVMKSPFLGVFGDSDKNVDVLNSIEVYEKIFKDNKKSDYELSVIKNANHELLDSKYNGRKELMTVYSILYGDDIFAKGALDLMVDWLNRTLR